MPLIKEQESLTVISDEETGDPVIILRRHPKNKKIVVLKGVEADIDFIADTIVPFSLSNIKTP